MRPPPALTLGAKATAELLERFGLRPDKSRGQHFLIDPNQVDRIVRAAGVNAGDHVVEVGPGLGALTDGLVDAGAQVVAVEIDDALVEVMAERFESAPVTVVNADALQLDAWTGALAGVDDWAMIANLPYNVATPLVLDVLDHVPQVQSMLVMVQREVGERLVAQAGTSEYGMPSVKVAYWATGSVVARIPPSVFLPQPRVESALVKLTRRDELLWEPSIDEVFELVRPAFAQRRKMLRRSLRGVLEPEAFEAAEIEPTRRPEELDVEQWCRLAMARRLGLSERGEP